MKNWPVLLLLITFVSCRTKPVDPELARWEKQAADITIMRDDFGVPHVYGKTDADAVFGLLYAQCEDDFKRVERNYIWAIGRLAEVEGEESLYSDLRARLFMTKEEAIDHYESSPKWLKKTLSGLCGWCKLLPPHPPRSKTCLIDALRTLDAHVLQRRFHWWRYRKGIYPSDQGHFMRIRHLLGLESEYGEWAGLIPDPYLEEPQGLQRFCSFRET